MKRERVAKIWVHHALCDLYFAFDTKFYSFESYERFAEIMGMEKFLKAAILFNRHKEYEFLAESEAKIKINKIASSYRHNFDGMILELTEIGITEFDRIKNTDYDGYPGIKLVDAVTDGDTLPTGSTIKVVEIIDDNLILVEQADYFLKI